MHAVTESFVSRTVSADDLTLDRHTSLLRTLNERAKAMPGDALLVELLDRLLNWEPHMREYVRESLSTLR